MVNEAFDQMVKMQANLGLCCLYMACAIFLYCALYENNKDQDSLPHEKTKTRSICHLRITKIKSVCTLRIMTRSVFHSAQPDQRIQCYTNANFSNSNAKFDKCFQF